MPVRTADRRWFRLMLPLLLFAGLWACGTGSPDGRDRDEDVADASMGATTEAALRSILEGRGSASSLSGLQIGLMEGGVAADGYALGFAQRIGDQVVPLRRDHRIRVASISKLVVAIGFMRLVEAGEIDLDDDVSSLLGFPLRNPAFPDVPITSRQLLAHTSSLRDGAGYFLPAGERFADFFTPGSDVWDADARFAGESDRAPGRYFEYANVNFGVLATLIERVSGERFDRFMRRRVLQPLGLEASFNVCDLSSDQRAAGFRKRDDAERWDPDGPWRAQVDGDVATCFYGMPDDPDAAAAFLAAYEPGSNASLFSPQGGLRASADDLVVIMRLLAGGGEVDGVRLLRAETVEQMLAPEWTHDPSAADGATWGEAEPGGATDGLMTSYGLSVHRIAPAAWGLEDAPHLLLGHLGEAYGVLGHLLFDPVSGDGIATIITGTADDPAAAPAGTSPLYRAEEEVLRWWLAQRR